MQDWRVLFFVPMFQFQFWRKPQYCAAKVWKLVEYFALSNIVQYQKRRVEREPEVELFGTYDQVLIFLSDALECVIDKSILAALFVVLDLEKIIDWRKNVVWILDQCIRSGSGSGSVGGPIICCCLNSHYWMEDISQWVFNVHNSGKQRDRNGSRNRNIYRQ